MKRRSPILIACSIALTLVLALTIVIAPTAVASANQMGSVQSKSTYPGNPAKSARPNQVQPKPIDSKGSDEDGTPNTGAIETLEQLVDNGLQTAGIFLKLGNLYGQAGLTTPAQDNYEKAIAEAIANKDKDVEVLIAAKTELAKIKKKLGKIAEAKLLNKEVKADIIYYKASLFGTFGDICNPPNCYRNPSDKKTGYDGHLIPGSGCIIPCGVGTPKFFKKSGKGLNQ